MIVKYIKIFIAFITPIIGKALAQTAADEIDRRASRPGSANWHRERQGGRPVWNTEKRQFEYARGVGPTDIFKTGDFHDVLLVAFDITGPNPQVVHEWLHNQMPKPERIYGQGTVETNVMLDSWWVANDMRFDGSDTDSAIFIPKGKQNLARQILRENGL